MIGYNKDKLRSKSDTIIVNYEKINSRKTKITASFYKILMDFNESNGIHKEVFFILFAMAFASRRNIYRFSDRGANTVYNESFIPELNRALYSQEVIRKRISKPSDIPSWVIYSFEAIGNSNFVTVLAIFAIHFNMDIEDLFPSNEKITYFISNTNLLSREKFITFEEIKSACENYELRQV